MEQAEFERQMALNKKNSRTKKIGCIGGVIVLLLFIVIVGVLNDKKNFTVEKPTKKVEENKTFWRIFTFVDDFGDPTKDKYLYLDDIEGKFSNSATSNSFCGVELIVTKTSVGIFLHEYSWTSPATYFIGTGTILAKNRRGEKIKLYSFGKWSEKGGISVNKGKELIDFIKKSEGDIRVVVQDEYSSVYEFTFNTYGFRGNFERL